MPMRSLYGRVSMNVAFRLSITAPVGGSRCLSVKLRSRTFFPMPPVPFSPCTMVLLMKECFCVLEYVVFSSRGEYVVASVKDRLVYCSNIKVLFTRLILVHFITTYILRTI